MKSVFGLLLLLCGLTYAASAQDSFQRVEREQVKTAVSDPALSTHYPKLLARFTASDTTLTPADYRNLYYGFVFQPQYHGYMEHQKRSISQKLQVRNYPAALATCDSVLAEIPVSITANYLKGLALFLQDSTNAQARQYGQRYRNLRNAILSSGNGLSCETAFKTIFVTDEYEIMYRYLEIKNHKSQSLVGSCDLFDVEPSSYFQASSLYFDTSETLLSLRNQLEAPRSKASKKRKK